MNKEDIRLSMGFMVSTVFLIIVFFLDLLIKKNISIGLVLVMAVFCFMSACYYYDQGKTND